MPFDRTIKVSLTERLTKEQILARMPHNLANARRTCLDANRAATSRFRFVRSIQQRTNDAACARAFLRRRRKCLQLVEELSLRTRRVQPLMQQLKEFAPRMDAIQTAAGRDRATTRLHRIEARTTCAASCTT